MPTEPRVVTREELYDLLWNAPLRDVARKLYLRPASLKRSCLRLRVPVPGIAHWRKKWQGIEDDRPPLPPAREGDATELRVRRAVGGAGQVVPAEPPAEAEPPLPQHVVVPDQLGPLHPVLREAMPRIRETADRLTEDPRRSISWISTLIGVTKPSLDRALRITNALLFAVETAGHEVRSRPRNADPTTVPSTTGVWVDGEFVDLLIYGHYSMVPLPPLPERRKETREEAIARMFRRKVDYRPNGVLTIHVGTRAYGSPKWTDRDRSKLEARLHEVVDEVVRYAAETPARAAARQRQVEEKRATERRRAEAEAARTRERSRFDDLRQRSEDWGRAQTMRAFVDAVEAEANARRAMTADFAAWVAWAKGKAREAVTRCVSELAR